MKKLCVIIAIFTLTAEALGETRDLFLQAGKLLSAGDFIQAAEYYDRYAESCPGEDLSAAAIFNAASIRQMELNDNDAALKGFRLLIKEYPASQYTAEAFRRCGEITMETGEAEDAFDDFAQAVKCSRQNENTTSYWLNQVAELSRNCLEQVKDKTAKLNGCRMMKELLPCGPAKAQNSYHYAGLLKEAGRTAEAAEEYYFLVSQFPINRWGQTAAKEQDELLKTLFPDYSAEIMDEFGRIEGLARQGNYAEVNRIVQKIKGSAGNDGWLANAQYTEIISNVYLTGDFETGLAQMLNFLDKRPERKNEAQAQLFLESWNNILKLLDQAADNPDDYGIHEQLGFVLLQNRYYNLAEAHFLLAAANPAATNAFLGLGYVYLRTSQPDKAVEKLEIYLKDNPEDGNTFNQVGYAYLQIGRQEDALRCFARYRDLEPDNPNAHDSYAECLMNMGQLEEAIAEYNRALELDRNWSNGVFMLGEIYRQKDDKVKAMEYYQRYLSMEPDGILSGQAQEALAGIKGNSQ